MPCVSAVCAPNTAGCAVMLSFAALAKPPNPLNAGRSAANPPSSPAKRAIGCASAAACRYAAKSSSDTAPDGPDVRPRACKPCTARVAIPPMIPLWPAPPAIADMVPGGISFRACSMPPGNNSRRRRLGSLMILDARTVRSWPGMSAGSAATCCRAAS